MSFMITEMSVLVFQGGYCFIDCDININLYTKKHNITSRSKVKIQFGRPLSMKMFETRIKLDGPSLESSSYTTSTIQIVLCRVQ